MKGVEYVLQCCEDAVDEYFSAVDDSERADAVLTLEVLTDILDVGDMPLWLVLRCHDVCQDVMMRHYGDYVISFM